MANENDKLQQEQQLNNRKNPSSLSDNEVISLNNETATITAASNFADGGEVSIGANNNNSATDLDGSLNEHFELSSEDAEASCSSSTTLISSVQASVSVSSSSSALLNTRSQLTDLVADVCFNGVRSSSDNSAATTLPVGFGDCTNIRATVGVSDFNEGLNIRRVESNLIDSQCTITNPIQQPTQSPAMHIPTVPTQNASTFSFKHFLSSSSSAFTAPSTTVTSLDPICSVAASSASTSSTTSTTIATTTSSTLNGSTQYSTGARPKVPQSASHTSSVGGSSMNSNAADGGDTTGSSVGSTRMKRSPRFSSFDSQASLTEYAATGRSGLGGGDDFSLFSGPSNPTGFRLHPSIGTESSSSASKRNTNLTTAAAQNTGFPSASFDSASTIGDDCSGIGVGVGIGSDYRSRQQQQQYVPRSYSNYEMPLPAPMSPSPRRRIADGVANVASNSMSSTSTSASASGSAGAGATASNRPNRLSLHPSNPSKLKLDLPIDSITAHITGPSDFPPASAAALPDFVQDHWMDALYLHDMQLNSPRSSPTRDFVKATASAVWSNMGAVGGIGGNSNINASVNNSGGALSSSNASNNFTSEQNAHIESVLSVLSGGVGGGGGVGSGSGSNNTGGAIGSGIANINAANNVSNGNGSSKMLPDFLSDGPIIHSSQRLADVAAGLPSNSIGSPEDHSMTTQLSKLCLENERLQRELSETRNALVEQTRRANELERQLQEENRRRAATPTAQQVMRLKQQLAEMAEEAELLRRENEALREDGAVGGYSDNTSGQRTESRYARPQTTRSQQISQALLRAASNAENNLRQLLAGVDNLRQMAADIEDPALRLDYEGSADMFPDFVDDLDGFEDFSGGPAL